MNAVAVGEIFDGIVFYGPFEDFDTAEQWAYDEVDMSSNWWIIGLNPPSTK